MTVHPIRGEDASLPVAPPAQGTLLGVVALTSDPLLIRALEDLSGNGVDVCVVTDLRTLTDELLQHAGGAALIDAEALAAPVLGVVDAIARQLPELRLMVAGHGAEQQQLASRIASQVVFRFVHKPVSPQRLRLFLESAARPTDQTGTVRTLAVPARDVAAVGTPSGRGGIPRMAIITAAAVLAAVAATWALWPGDDSSGNSAAPTAATSGDAGTQAAILRLLAQADAAVAAGRLVASDGSSAAELYGAALKLDAGNRKAADGRTNAIDQALRRAEEAVLAGRLNEAGNVVAAVGLIAPDNPRLAFLNAQISREQARLNSDATQRQLFEASQASIRAAVSAMNERLRRGALLDPGSTSAISSFREAEAIGANDEQVRAAREALVAALLTAADAELAARRPPMAQRLVDAARSINSNAPGLDILHRRVEEVVAQLAVPEPSAPPVARVEPPPPEAPPAPPVQVIAPAPPTAAPPSATPPATATAPAAATAAARAGSEVISAGRLQLLRRQEAVYPERALQQLVSGWVALEFTVATDGSVRDIRVTDAQPKNTFDAAAITALSRYRYAPVLRDGVAIAQRATLRMRFTAQDAQ